MGKRGALVGWEPGGLGRQCSTRLLAPVVVLAVLTFQ